MAEGVQKAIPDATVIEAPFPDGGEGFAHSILEICGGKAHPVRVIGPVGLPVTAVIGILPASGGELTAVIDVASACGLSLVPPDQRNPTRTTSYGLGELIGAAVSLGARKLLIGCGDSGVNDGGAGMMQALGARLLNRDGYEIGRGGGALTDLAKIDVSAIDQRVLDLQIDVAVNWQNVLLGERGVTRVYSRQKGVSGADEIRLLESGMARLAHCILETTGVDVAAMPGGGASGGIGASLAGLLGAELHPRYDIAQRYIDFDRLLAEADVVLTGEGMIDAQTAAGKLPSEIGRRAKALGKPVIALAGSLADGIAEHLSDGVSAYRSVLARPCSLEEAYAEAQKLIADAAEQTTRVIEIGRRVRKA
jgi:glycerate 2-kinase